MINYSKLILYRHKNNFLLLLTIFFIISINFVSWNVLRSDFLNVDFSSDDPQHINIAKNFRDTKNFIYDFTPVWGEYTTDFLIKNWPEIPFPEDSKGPIFYVLLGSFYQFMNTQPENFLLHAGYFNSILSSTFFILFFF